MIPFSLLEAWFQKEGRDFPWQKADPYGVWVSEIMLQQTTVNFVQTRFPLWMKQFPDLKTLARATEEEVLRAWEGLGYYSRARNLHKAAVIMHGQGLSQPPPDQQSLLALPGIGEYTCAAILSLGYNQPQPVYEANVRRILARLAGGLPRDPGVKKAYEGVDEDYRNWILGAQYPSQANSLLMQFGQIVCVPREPLCPQCSLSAHCVAYSQGRAREIPRKKPKKIKHLQSYALLAIQDDKIALVPPGRKGVLGGLWTLPLVDYSLDLIPLSAKDRSFVHYYTQYKHELYPLILSREKQTLLEKVSESWLWVELSSLGAKTFPSVHRKLIDSVIISESEV